MKEIKTPCHSVLRYGISKMLVASTLILISVNAFADMSNCVSATKAESWNKAIEYCEPLAGSNKDALVLVSWAYTELDEGVQAQKYLQKYVDKYAKSETNNTILSNGYTGLGNAYYFGAYGATRDIKKGLEYITKGAQLGNPVAQEQLGSIYGSNEAQGVNKNFVKSYYWYTLEKLNGGDHYMQSYVYKNIGFFKKQGQYCLALANNMIAQAYINEDAGLSKNDNQARQYLIQAIELYKEAKKPSEDELEYCPKQKGLDLASAEKLLKSL